MRVKYVKTKRIEPVLNHLGRQSLQASSKKEEGATLRTTD